MVLLLVSGGLGGSFQAPRIVAAGVLPFLLLSRSPDDRLHISWRSFGWAFAAMLFFGLVSLSWSWDVDRGVGILIAVLLGGTLVFLAKHMDRSAPWLRLIRLAWCAAAGIACVQGLYEITTGNHFAYALESRNLGGDLGDFPYASGFFGNYNDFSVFLCMSLPFVLLSMFKERNVLMTTILISLYAVMIFIVFVNTSRGCIAFALTCSFVILFKLVKKYFLVVLSASLFMSFVANYTDAVGYLSKILFTRLEYSGFSDRERLDLLWAGIEGVREYWGMGMGVGSFESYLMLNYPALIASPHNIFLEIAANFGLVSLVTFMLWLIVLFAAARKSEEGIDTNQLIVRSCLLGLPVLGAVSSQAIVYIYWFGWLATLAAFAAPQLRRAAPVDHKVFPPSALSHRYIM